MSALRSLKNDEDWHPADVIAALKKVGSSLAAIEREAKYAKRALSSVWQQRWPKAQRLIAEKIGIEPWKIWPSRYDADHTALTGKPKKHYPSARQFKPANQNGLTTRISKASRDRNV